MACGILERSPPLPPISQSTDLEEFLRTRPPAFPLAASAVTFCGDTNPVEVASQLLGDVGLATGWEANHDYHSGGIGKLRPTGCKEKEQELLILQLTLHRPNKAFVFIQTPPKSFSSWRKHESHSKNILMGAKEARSQQLAQGLWRDSVPQVTSFATKIKNKLKNKIPNQGKHNLTFQWLGNSMKSSMIVKDIGPIPAAVSVLKYQLWSRSSSTESTSQNL